MPTTQNNTNVWELTDIVMPASGQAGASVQVGDDIYFIGGVNAQNVTINEVKVFNYKNKHWSLKEPLHTGVYGITASYCNGKIYVPGGHPNLNSTAVTNLMQIYDISTNTWTTRTMPYSADYISSTAIGDKIYFAGGRVGTATSHGAYTHFYEYNTISEVFTKMPDMLIAAATGCKLVHYNDTLYYFGGFYGAPPKTASACQKYSFVDDRWDLIEQCPDKISYAPSAQIGTDIYIIGGSIPPAKSEVYKYSLSTDTWRQITSLPVGLNDSFPEVIDGTLYVFGGRNHENVTLNSVYVYTPESQPPIDPPIDPPTKPELEKKACCCGSMKFELNLPVCNNVEALRELGGLLSKLNSCDNPGCSNLKNAENAYCGSI